ncbi:MAG: VacJ family lipoprotein [Deltaproteobacteria bacterium]|nr:VacJ family lipoprotein [Deltaproteobacteria bacterium]
MIAAPRRPRLRARSALLAFFAIVLAATGCATPERPDPLEKMNRGIFAFNEGLDRYALEPVATAYDFVVPGLVQDGVRNFFHNLEMPIVIANEILQAKPVRVVEDVARFFFNTTLGIGGFIDVATRVGIPDNDEDFGQTLGYWGVPPGPYLVVPILGPYTLRDGIGEIADTTAGAYAYMNFFWFDVVGLSTWETTGVSVGTYAYRMLNLRAIYLEEIEGSRKDAFDYYAFVRNAYLSNRQARVLDSTDSAAAVDEDLYELDEEDDEESYDLDLEEDAGTDSDGDSDAGAAVDEQGAVDDDGSGEAGSGDPDAASDALNEGDPEAVAADGSSEDDETGGEEGDGED